MKEQYSIITGAKSKKTYKNLTGIILIISMFLMVLSGCKPKPADVTSTPVSKDNSSASSASSLAESVFSDASSVDTSSDQTNSDTGSIDTTSDDEFTYSRAPLPTNIVNSASATTGNYIEGLLNPSIVGINKNDFYKEVKYPAPTVVDYKIIATDYGVIANDKKDDTVALASALAFAKSKPADKTKKIVLPAGDLDFIEGFNSLDDRYGIVIDSIDNLTLEGTNTNIYFYNGSLGYRGFHIVKCKNFLLTKVNIDWGIPPYVMGTVTAFDEIARTADVTVNKGYTVGANTNVIEYLEYDKRSNLPRDNGNFLYNHNDVKNIKNVAFLGSNKLKLSFGTAVTKAPVGTKVALASGMHFSETFIVENCENLKCETVNLYSSPGMAFKAYTCTNLYFNRFNAIVKPGTDRLMTGTADILHLKNTAGEIIITNCTFENSHDDAVNVGGHYMRIREISGNRLRVLSPLGMWGTFKPAVGDKYEVSNIQTLEVIKSLTVTKVEDSNDGYWITVAEGTAGLEINNALANITRTPKLIFKNNLVRNKRNRGLLCQTRNVLIENNAFSNVLQGPISLLSEVNNFNESTAPKDVMIRNNKFINNNQYATADIEAAAYGPGFSIGSPAAISGITIENNFFAYSKNAAMAFKGASKIFIKGNLIYNPATNPSEGKTNSAILLENVKTITITKNKIYGGTQFGYRSVFMSGGVDANTIKLSEELNSGQKSDNIGIDLKDVYGEEKIITIAKSNANINFLDKNLSDWNNVGTSIAMNAATDINVKEVNLALVPASDFSQTTKYLWKDDGIYFSFNIRDESLQFIQSEWYKGDGMELFLTTETLSFAKTDTIRLFNDDTLQIFMKPDNYGGNIFYLPRTSKAVYDKKDQIKLSFWTDSTGYKGEGYIPFTVIPGVKSQILAGKAIGISVNFGDSDEGDSEINPMDKFMTFSTVRHPTTENKMTPANMTKFMFLQ